MNSGTIKEARRLKKKGYRHHEIARLLALTEDQVRYACNTEKEHPTQDPSPEEIAKAAAEIKAANLAKHRANGAPCCEPRLPRYYVVLPQGFK